MSAETINVEPVGVKNAPLTDIPRRVLASNGGAWFAWGFIGGIMFAGAALYLVKKKL